MEFPLRIVLSQVNVLQRIFFHRYILLHFLLKELVASVSIFKFIFLVHNIWFRIIQYVRIIRMYFAAVSGHMVSYLPEDLLKNKDNISEQGFSFS